MLFTTARAKRISSKTRSRYYFGVAVHVRIFYNHDTATQTKSVLVPTPS